LALEAAMLVRIQSAGRGWGNRDGHKDISRRDRQGLFKTEHVSTKQASKRAANRSVRQPVPQPSTLAASASDAPRRSRPLIPLERYQMFRVTRSARP